MDDNIYFLSKLTLLSPVKMIFAKSPAINGNSSCWLKNEQITPIVVPWGWVLSIVLLLHGVLLYSSLTIVLDPLVLYFHSSIHIKNFGFFKVCYIKSELHPLPVRLLGVCSFCRWPSTYKISVDVDLASLWLYN